MKPTALGFGLAAAALAAWPLAASAQLYSPAQPPSASASAAPPPASTPPAHPETPPLQTPASAAAPAQPQSQVQTATEQRISALMTSLAITPAQMPQWTAFAQVMRDNARNTDALFRQRAETARTMNAVANLQSYAAITQAYSDGTVKLASAFKALYDALSDQQKQTADGIFRQQATQNAAAAPK